MYIKCKSNESNFLTWYRGDFFHIKEVSNANQYQACEIDEHKQIKSDLLYIIGNESIRKSIYIKFDFENSTFELNGKKFNVIKDYEFTFKKIKGNNLLALNGIEGFYNFILESMNLKDSAFCSYTFGVLQKLGKIEFNN